MMNMVKCNGKDDTCDVVLKINFVAKEYKHSFHCEFSLWSNDEAEMVWNIMFIGWGTALLLDTRLSFSRSLWIHPCFPKDLYFRRTNKVLSLEIVRITNRILI